MSEAIAMVNLVCAAWCVKLAGDLGYGLTRRGIHFIGGLLFGPLVLLHLYILIARKPAS